jgi:hypothetical protein
MGIFEVEKCVECGQPEDNCCCCPYCQAWDCLCHECKYCERVDCNCDDWELETMSEDWCEDCCEQFCICEG